MPTHDRAPATALARPAVDDRVTLAEASALARRDRKTLMKDITDGRFPHAIQQPGGRRTWTLLVQDLLDAGLVEPHEVAPARHTRSRAEAGSCATSSEQLRVLELEARVQAQEAVVEALRDEVARLHELAMALVARLGTASRTPGGAP